MSLTYPNRDTAQINQERAINYRKLAQYVMMNSHTLPEMRASSDGLTGYYWDYMAKGGDFTAYIYHTLPALFVGLQRIEDITIADRADGRTVQVFRAFGDVSVSLVYCWDYITGPNETERPKDIVEHAVMVAWSNERGANRA